MLRVMIASPRFVLPHHVIGAPYTARQKSCPQRSQRSSRS